MKNICHMPLLFLVSLAPIFIELNAIAVQVPHSLTQQKQTPDDKDKSWKMELAEFFHQPNQTPLQRALRYLERKCSPTVGYQLEISNSTTMDDRILVPTEVYSSALILDLIHDIPDLSPKIPKVLINFLRSNQGSPGQFVYNCFVDQSIAPNDVDVTSVALSALLSTNSISHFQARHATIQMVTNVGDDGVIQVYFPPYNDTTLNGIVDVGVITNVMRVVATLGMRLEITQKSQDHVLTWLLKNGNDKTTLYWPDTFIYFLSNSVKLSRKVQEKFWRVLWDILDGRFGGTTTALDISMRIMAAENLGMFSASRDGFASRRLEEKIMKEALPSKYNHDKISIVDILALP